MAMPSAALYEDRNAKAERRWFWSIRCTWTRSTGSSRAGAGPRWRKPRQNFWQAGKMPHRLRLARCP